MCAWKHRLFSPLLVVAVMLLWGSTSAFATDVQTFSGAQLVPHAGNDGDSFLVAAGGKHIHLRLYFADCPETSVSLESDVQRVREQTRYFGLPHGGRTVHFGREAQAFVARTLATPFTVHTAFASALGRSTRGRVYGFVTTADGHDLATLLIQHGLARAHGVGRETPDGTPRDEMFARLHDLEASAMLKRTGVWAESDADRIAALRAEQRREEQQLQTFQQQVQGTVPAQGPLDLNTASETELQSVKGIGPALAARIVAGRPYRSVDDLLNIPGIGPNKLAEFRERLVVGP